VVDVGDGLGFGGSQFSWLRKITTTTLQEAPVVAFADSPLLIAVSRWDRILAFAACNLGALACFVVCFTLFPVLSLRPRKFAVL
jgi:hypothetical protein